jgi:hypothetical protein
MFNREDYFPYMFGVFVFAGLIAIPVIFGQFIELPLGRLIGGSVVGCFIFAQAHTRTGEFLFGRFTIGVVVGLLLTMNSGGASYLPGGVLGFAMMAGGGWLGVWLGRFLGITSYVDNTEPSVLQAHDDTELAAEVLQNENHSNKPDDGIFEYRTFVFGVFLLGGFFGTVIFRNLSEFWDSAPSWSLASALGASLLLCLTPIVSYRPQSGLKIRLLLLSLVLTVGLVMWYDAGRSMSINGTGTKGLLLNIQLANSWTDRFFVLIPIALSILAHWLCGGFLLSLRRFIVNRKNSSLSISPVLLVSTTASIAVLLAFTIWSLILTKDGPIFVNLQFPESTPTEQRDLVVNELKAKMLQRVEGLESINVFVGSADGDHAQASSIYAQQILFKINQMDRWRRGKQRKRLIADLRVYENIIPRTQVSVFDETSRPSVPTRDSYTLSEVQFVPNSPLLERLGISETRLFAALATRLRLSSGGDSLHTLQGFNLLVEEGVYINIKHVSSVEVISSEVRGSDLPTPYWKPLSQDRDTELPGIAIILDETSLERHGVDLGELEATIIEHLRAEESSTDIDLLSQLTIATSKNKSVIRLGDIALIEQQWMKSPQGEVNGVPYKIQLRARWQ